MFEKIGNTEAGMKLLSGLKNALKPGGDQVEVNDKDRDVPIEFGAPGAPNGVQDNLAQGVNDLLADSNENASLGRGVVV